MELKGRVLVYSITGCPHCMRAKNLLNERGVPYTDINLDTYPQCREPLRVRTGRSTVPQVYFNERHVGGNDDLQRVAADATEWEELVALVRDNEPSSDAPEPPDPATAKDASAADDSGFVCEPDDYAKLVSDLRSSGLIKDRRQGLRTQKSSFIGREFVDWLCAKKELTRAQAVESGQQLIGRHFGRTLSKNESEVVFKDDDTLYRLLEDDDSNALNAGVGSECTPRPAAELGEELRRLILQIYSAFLSSDGRGVDYAGIAKSKEFQKYEQLTKELVRVDVESATREERLAFFINIYNALVIHANIVRGPATNLWQRWKFFNTVRYIIGGHTYNLQDIENGVLRSNRRGVGQFSLPFSASDPRRRSMLEQNEPLIHFALVCGAKSCPPIKTYSAAGIDSQLRLAAESFLEGDDGCQIIAEKREVRFSKIFSWYKVDFGGDDHSLLRFAVNHMGDGKKKEQLEQLVKDGGKVKVGFLKYDWSVNSK